MPLRLTLSKDLPIESQSPSDAAPLLSSFLSFLTDPPSTTRKISDSLGTIGRKVRVGVKLMVRSLGALEAISIIMRKLERGVILGVTSTFAANASCALSVSWSSTSGSSIFLKMASTLLFCSVHDRTLLCTLAFESILRRIISGSLL